MANIVFSAMGTKITISIDHPEAQQLLLEVKAQLLDYEYRFSANRPDSQLMRINANAGIASQKVDSDLFELIKIGKQYSLMSGSTLNIAIGPLVKLWKIGFNGAQVPNEEDIQARLQLINPQHIHLNEAEKSVFLEKEGMEIDLGALAKGYFADLVKRYLLSCGVASGIINLGGNVLLIGQHPNHPDGFWRVGIQAPDKKRDHLQGIVQCKDVSIVTSGIYERQLEYEGESYHHIFDSQTGYPVANDLASVTIVSKTSLLGEIYTSLYYKLDSRDLLNKLAGIDDLEAVIIDKNGHVLFTEGLKPFYTSLT